VALRERFWERVSLEQMTDEEWESLCDGCGKCCLHKLQDEDTDEVYYTRVACRLLDPHSCRCRDYVNRRRQVAHCVVLEVSRVAEFDWLPSSCAYRLLAEGQPLAQWHYLLSGDLNSIHSVGMSVRGATLSSEYVHSEDMQQHIINWVD
jgi:uncharacterized cysteine cluster protein YcgN (CxxCxxCC family)